MKIESVQGLRALAALAVVVSHSIGELIEHGSSDAQHVANAFGEAGVRVFFVISGFIMAVTMREYFGQPGAAREFLVKRLIRIVPLYWLVTFAYIAIVLVPKGELPSGGDLAMSLAFIPYLNHGQYWPIYVPGWTLNYEMMFYAIFAIALFRTRGIAIVLGTLALFAVAGLFFESFYTEPIILYFAAGIVLAMVREKFTTRLGATTVFAISTVLMLVYCVCIPQNQVAQVLVCIAIAALGTLTTCQPTKVDRPVLDVGDASYSIYLTHSFVVGVSTPLIAHMPPAAWLAMMLAGAIVVGVLSYRLVELPMTQALKHVVTRRVRHRS